MIKPINSISFCGSNRRSDMKKIKQSDYSSTRNAPTDVDYSKYDTKPSGTIPRLSALALAALLMTTGTVVMVQNVNSRTTTKNPTETTEVAGIKGNTGTQAPKEMSPAEAAQIIQASPELKEVYGSIIQTIQNMEKTVDDPIGEIRKILDEPYAKGVELEYVLAQIFSESTGNHYDKNGDVLLSSAECAGWMQMGEEAASDLNNGQFRNDKKDRNNPIDNLELGICLNSQLLKRFDGDLFDALAAYNCGPKNVLNGKDYGDAYAARIIKFGNALKENPELTKLLFEGKLDEYKINFLYG